MDRHELTNAEFVRFVGATGYKTLAERPPPAIHGASPDMMQPGSAVFTVPTHDDDRWWKWVVGANWRMPEGPKSSISGRDDYPVVQLAYEDVLAYARWADKALPSEEQWEYAARGGKIRQTYAWGEERDPGGVPQANYYQGVFPRKDLGIDGHIGRAPVGCYNANAFGLYDMIGNVWEWTSRAAGTGSEVRIIKGGSYLCAENYCRRYRPSARQLQEHDLGTNHIGVRFVKEG
jgi:formylglycine-generating enzyme required for sulfatase activity